MNPTDIFASLKPIVERAGPFSVVAPESFDVILEEVIQPKKVLMVGAGGLGCEALKNLVMSGFKRINVVDLDTIDVSNLNRQFMFREQDVGKYKSIVAAEYVKKRRPGLDIKPHTEKLQSYTKKWVRNHDIAVACLDNNEARLYLNEVLVDGVRFLDECPDDAPEISTNACLEHLGLPPAPIDALVRHFPLATPDPDTVCLLVDGGTEGWRGHAKVTVPMLTSCVQCTAAAAPPEGDLHLHMCTIAHVPRTPEHCVMYAQEVLWHQLEYLHSHTHYRLSGRPERAGEGEVGFETFSGGENVAGVELDKDDEQHMTWLWARACERARYYGIAEPSYADTLRVVKGIIPAVGATNALVSAVGVTEAVKWAAELTQAPYNRYWVFLSDQYTSGANIQLTQYARDPRCTHCHPRTRFLVPRTATLLQLVAAVCRVAALDKPFITCKDDLNVGARPSEDEPRASLVAFHHRADEARTDLLCTDRFTERAVYEASRGNKVFKFEVQYT